MKLKLSIVSSLLILLVVGSISAMLFFFEEKVLLENKKENQVILFDSFVKIIEDAMILEDRLLLLDFCTMLKQITPSNVYSVFQETSGSIISAGSDEMIYFATKKLGAKGVKTPRGYLVRESPGPGGDEIVDFSSDIFIDGKKVGVAQLGFSATILREELSTVIRDMRRTIIYLACGALIIGIVGSLVFAIHIIRPIKILAEGASKIGAGNLNYRIPVTSQDELGWLAGEFNTMGDRLVELDQMKSDFVSNVTHELRSPLGAIKSYLELLEKEKEIPASAKDYLSRIRMNTRRLAEFIDNLLDVSRIDQGKVALAAHAISLDTIAAEVIKNFAALAREKNIPIESKISSVLPPVSADPGKIEQVFTNLISNALKFTPQNGTIVIDAQEMSTSRAPHFGSRFIRVAVTDSGPGIVPNDLQRIFNKFEQAHHDGPASKGTGLGLSIVKGIVEAHGGHVWINSRMGKGATFYFTLKIAPHNKV